MDDSAQFDTYMPINSHNIKKWYRMLAGKSILHVNQDIGKYFIPGKIAGYYNNMTEKVNRQAELLENERLPMIKTEQGENVYFPVAIFQYGLGAYDLYLKTNKEVYIDKFKQCVEWTIKNQESSGAWNNFCHIFPKYPYGAMCQGEGASLLVRAYKHFADSKYLEHAHHAIDFMLEDVDHGGTTSYKNGTFLLEYTHLAPVMNGWIFALWGLYDINLISPKNERLRIYTDTLNTLIQYLPKFNCGYWSMYNLNNAIASPFYHRLHIAQMQALYCITNNAIFDTYAKRWAKQNTNLFCKSFAFTRKAIQKVFE